VIPRLVVASKNPDKIIEVEAILAPLSLVDEIVKGLDWPDVEETGSTLEENALLKARAAMIATGLPAIADDTGLEVEALGGRPGVRTARFAGPNATYQQNVDELLRVLEGETRRGASFRTAVALVFPDGVEVFAGGSVSGRITVAPRGTGGFGYDPVFEVEGRTLAEMDDSEKNQLSHRSLALLALGNALGL